VLWIGSELDELFAVSDRLFVLTDGELVGPFLPPFDRSAVGLAMAGGDASVGHPRLPDSSGTVIEAEPDPAGTVSS
jgi:ABC-type sugar transport system ATPase subunit